MSARAFCGTSLIALLLWAMPLAGQTDFDAIEIRTTSLGGGVYMLMGSGGNIGLSVGEDGAFIVDDQFAPLTEKIKAAIAEVTDRPVEWVSEYALARRSHRWGTRTSAVRGPSSWRTTTCTDG